jgi:hypothetical protein
MSVYRSPLKNNALLNRANNLQKELSFHHRYEIDKRMGLDVPDYDGDYLESLDIDDEEY